MRDFAAAARSAAVDGSGGLSGTVPSDGYGLSALGTDLSAWVFASAAGLVSSELKVSRTPRYHETGLTASGTDEQPPSVPTTPRNATARQNRRAAAACFQVIAVSSLILMDESAGHFPDGM